MSSLRPVWAAATAGCVLWVMAGCDGDSQLPTQLLEPLALESQLVLVDRGTDRAFVLEVGASSRGNVRRVKLPHGTRERARRRLHEEALILAVGRRATQDDQAEPGRLSALKANGELRSYELGNPFDRLVQSEDGKYAMLFKSGGSMRLLDNPNEVAIVDLDLAPDEAGAVTLRTLRSFGDSPSEVIFSPVMTIVGEARRLAVVLSGSNVTLVDLAHLDRRETTVQLSSSGGHAITPRDVAFHPTEPEIYVRASSSDLFVFNLRERGADDEPADAGDERNDFRPFIDQLGIGGEPSDMKLYTADAGTRLLVVSKSARVAATIDTATSQVTSVPLPFGASQALLFDAPSPRDDATSSRALLYDRGGKAVLFMDLADLELRGTRNLDHLQLEQPIEKLIPLLDEQQVLVVHDANGVSLIDLAARTISPITSLAALRDARFDAERRTLWFGPQGQPWVGLLDLATGETSEILLGANVVNLVPIFNENQVAIMHDDREGSITLIDTSDPKREATEQLQGFFLEDGS
jgi:hypothetical protein